MFCISAVSCNVIEMPLTITYARRIISRTLVAAFRRNTRGSGLVCHFGCSSFGTTLCNVESEFEHFHPYRDIDDCDEIIDFYNVEFTLRR